MKDLKTEIQALELRVAAMREVIEHYERRLGRDKPDNHFRVVVERENPASWIAQMVLDFRGVLKGDCGKRLLDRGLKLKSEVARLSRENEKLEKENKALKTENDELWDQVKKGLKIYQTKKGNPS